MTVYGGKVNDSGCCWEDPRGYDDASIRTVRDGKGRWLYYAISSSPVEGADVKDRSKFEGRRIFGQGRV